MTHRTDSNPRFCSTSGIFQFQFCRTFIVIMLLTIVQSFAQPAKNAGKFLGNTTTLNEIRPDFNTYWNHITGENESKWMSVEGTRNKMSWTGTDRIANFARENKIPWRFHSLFNYGSHPSWMANIPDTTLLREMGEWMDAAAARYPDVTMIDVFNECYNNNLPGIFRTALGGNGVTGFDWAIKAFKMARERWPNALLIYNDYNNIEYEDNIKWTIDLVTALQQANAPIDLIGCEANYTMNIATSKIKDNIDRIAATGLPVYISAFEIGTNSDSLQEILIREKFTMFWNHPKIIGITFWGYIVGKTWRSGTGLLTTDGVERPALTWLKNYVKDNPNPPNDFPHLLDRITDVKYPGVPVNLYSHTVQNCVRDGYKLFDLQGRIINRCVYQTNFSGTQDQQMSTGMYLGQPGKNSGNAASRNCILEIK